MYYSDEIIEEVRSRSDIVDVVSAYVKLQKKGSNYFGLCPFHNEKSASFSVSPAKQMYYCFGCGAGGNSITFVMQYENYTFPEAVKALADRAGMTLPEQEYTPEEKRSRDLKTAILDVNKMAAAYYFYQLRQPSGEPGMSYLKGRELSDQTMHDFGLGYAGKYSDGLYKYLKSKGISDDLLKESGLMNVDERRGMYDKFWNRVMFPIMDVNNRVIGFGGRVMGDGKPKYLNSPETKVFDKSRNLYGLNIARRSKRGYLIVCEGYMDVISMHQAGFTNAVASLGTALTQQHAALLRRYTDQVILSYDSDGAGVRAAQRAIPMMRTAGITAKVLNLKPYKDPDEFIKNMGTEAFEERLNNAQNAFMWGVEVLEQSYDMGDPEAKTKFFLEIASRIADFELELERENYIQAIAEKYHTGFDAMRRMVLRALMTGKTASAAASREPVDQGGGDVQERRPVRSTRKSSSENGILKSQRLLLTWLTEYSGFYNTVKEYVKPQDFTTDFYREVAGLLFTQLENGKVEPAQIIDHFQDAEEQQMAAQLFHTTVSVTSREEQIKAMKETIRKVVEASRNMNEEKLGTDLSALQEALDAKRRLEKLNQIEIRLEN